MGDSPIIKFHSKKQIQEYLDWWKSKLFLNDWIIHWNLVPFESSPLDGKYMGHTEMDYVNNVALITLAKYDTLPQDCIMHLCDEKVLVHELLHLVYPTYSSDSYEAFVLENAEHSRLEHMAKTLIMVKYDLPFEWFDKEYHKGGC